jgi:hypothetical protein
MPLSVYQITIPTMLRSFAVLSSYIDKAAAFARDNGRDPAELMQARLAPDMFTFAGQIQRASDKAKNGVARLAAIDAPSFEDTETTLEDLKARIAKTVAFLQSVDAKKFDGSEDRLVELKFRSVGGKLRGNDYLLSVLLPDFFFHVTTAHDILRNQGVQIGKLDYFGPLPWIS